MEIIGNFQILILATIIFYHQPVASFTCPEPCTCDNISKSVTCAARENPLSLIPKNIATDTEELYLNDNHIQKISANDFIGLANLRKLHLHKNHITHIDEFAFKDLASLIELNLNKNHLSYITKNTFFGLRMLKSLWLSEIHPKSVVPCIDDFTFGQTTALEELVLTNNDFLFISNNFFTGLSNLKYLAISLNHINKIDNLAFSNFKEGTIDVHLGPFSVCCCSTASAIESLRIQPSGVSCRREICYDSKEICAVPYDSTCVRKIRPVSPTPESSIPKPTRPPNTRKSSICPEECKCYNGFRDVLCHQKFLSWIPSNIPFEAEKLMLNENLITRIQKFDFYDLPYLKELYLHNNKIERLDDGCFAELANLTSLFLLNNYINQINPNTFQGLEKLKHLSLSNLHIKQLPISIEVGSFQTLGDLQSLQLNENRFTCLSEHILTGLDSLQLLTISMHLIGVLSSDVFDSLPSNASIQTDLYDIELCCCSTALAFSKTKSLKSFASQCKLFSCSDQQDPICKMSFCTSTSDTTWNIASIKSAESKTGFNRWEPKAKQSTNQDGEEQPSPYSPIQPSSSFAWSETIQLISIRYQSESEDLKYPSSPSIKPSLPTTSTHNINTSIPKVNYKLPSLSGGNDTQNSSFPNGNATEKSTLLKSNNTPANSLSPEGNNTGSLIDILQIQADRIEASDWGKDNTNNNAGNSLSIHHWTLVSMFLSLVVDIF